MVPVEQNGGNGRRRRRKTWCILTGMLRGTSRGTNPDYELHGIPRETGGGAAFTGRKEPDPVTSRLAEVFTEATRGTRLQTALQVLQVTAVVVYGCSYRPWSTLPLTLGLPPPV